MANNIDHRGYIKLWRCSVDNDLYFAEPFTKRQAWQDLILHANFQDNTIYIRGIEIIIKSGQIGWSEITMSERWKWSRNKVRRFLKTLETKQQIEQHKTKITTIITIKNYKEYQQNDTTSETTKGQQKDNKRYTNNNDKECKEGKEIYNDQFIEFWKMYPNKKGKDKARNKYIKIIGQGIDHKEIIKGLKSYLEEIEKKGTEKQYIKHPTTWLNGGHWTDEYERYVIKDLVTEFNELYDEATGSRKFKIKHGIELRDLVKKYIIYGEDKEKQSFYENEINNVLKSK